MAVSVSLHTIKFDYKIFNISELDEESTPEFMIQGIPWKIKFNKEDVDGEDWFQFYLYCENNGESDIWAYTAFAAVKVLSFDKISENHKCHSMPFIFDNNEMGFGEKIIKWFDLFDAERDFVMDDTVNLEIHIEVANPNHVNKSELKLKVLDKCCEECGHTSLQLIISNIDALMAVRTTKLFLRNLPWHINIYKNPSKHLGVRLENDGGLGEGTCKVKASFKLIPSKAGSESITKVCEDELENQGTVHIEEFLPWDELFHDESGFVVNNRIIFEVEIKAVKPAGVVPSNKKRETANGSTHEAIISKMECTICLENIRDQVVSSLPCSHLFCTACIENSIKRQKLCPLCKAQSNLNDLRRIRLPFVN